MTTTPTRTWIPLVTASLACLSLAACDREPTPKMGSADSVLSTPTPVADAGTAMGTGSMAGNANAPGLTMGQANTEGSGFETMTRTEPTGAGVPATSTTGMEATSSVAGTLSRVERDFIAQTGAKSLFEIRVSELAAEKATDPALKSYAAMVAADHKGVNEEVKRLAAGHGVNLPQSLGAQDQKTLSALQNVHGAAFDKQYLQTVGVTEHEKIIATYEKVSADAQNPAVKDYVQSTLPTLKSHLDAARKLQTKG